MPSIELRIREKICALKVIQHRSIKQLKVSNSISALTLLVGRREGIRPVKKLGVGLLVVTF